MKDVEDEDFFIFFRNLYVSFEHFFFQDFSFDQSKENWLSANYSPASDPNDSITNT